MTVSKTTVNTSFFKRVGNWFNKNGDTLGKSMQLAGTTAMGVGLTGMMFHEMNKKSCHHQSIFGGGFGGCCYPWSSMMSPYNMGGCGMFGGMNAMTNPYLTMMGMQSASNYGFLNAMASRQNIYTNSMNNPLYQSFYNQSYQKYYSQLAGSPTGINNPDAEVDYTAIDNGETALTQDEMNNTKDGEEMDTAFNKGKSFTYAENGASNAERKAGLEKYAKSYLAYVDKNEGDGDGLMSEDEFVEHEVKTSADATAARKIFKQFDLDNSGSLGWKEYAALMNAYDTDDDGVISTKEYKDAAELSKRGIESAIRREDGDKDIFRNRIHNSSKELGYSE